MSVPSPVPEERPSLISRYAPDWIHKRIVAYKLGMFMLDSELLPGLAINVPLKEKNTGCVIAAALNLLGAALRKTGANYASLPHKGLLVETVIRDPAKFTEIPEPEDVVLGYGATHPEHPTMQ